MYSGIPPVTPVMMMLPDASPSQTGTSTIASRSSNCTGRLSNTVSSEAHPVSALKTVSVYSPAFAGSMNVPVIPLIPGPDHVYDISGPEVDNPVSSKAMLSIQVIVSTSRISATGSMLRSVTMTESIFLHPVMVSSASR